MPIVSVNRDLLYSKLGHPFNSNENDKEILFEKLCFDFGIELDGIVNESELNRPQFGESQNVKPDKNDAIYLKIEVPSNRYDLVCLEGIANALCVFLGKQPVKKYQVKTPQKNEILTINVDKNKLSIRPIMVGAIIRDLKLDNHALQCLIDLQEKLHFNICRQRSLASIGLHNLDSLKLPLHYTAMNRDDIRFVALNEAREMSATELFDEYQQRSQCSVKPYLKLLEGSEIVPILFDANNIVCSLPPIINGEHSKIGLDTKNILIEVTATDITKAEIVLNTLCSVLSEYSNAKTDSIESIEINFNDNKKTNSILNKKVYPQMKIKTIDVSICELNKLIGLSLNTSEIIKLLKKMQLDSEIKGDDFLKVFIPPTRSDILHPCDVMEDVAIAFGYNNIHQKMPTNHTEARQQPINNFSDKIRIAISQCGYMEVLTWILTSIQDNFKSMLNPDTSKCVIISGPKTKELEICRTSLLPGLLKSVSHNLGKIGVPIKIFEVGDVVILDTSDPKNTPEIEYIKTGAVNRTFLAALYLGRSSESFEITNGLLDRVMEIINIPFKEDAKDKENEPFYYLENSNYQHYFPGRQAQIKIKNKSDDYIVGSLGIMHPEVCDNFNDSINTNGFIISAVELDLTCLMKQARIN